jgi:hypothetical protein
MTTFHQRATAAPPDPSAYIETIGEFLDGDDPPVEWIFPELVPCGVIILVHGNERARKSLVAFEFALSAATATPPFGLARFQPPVRGVVLYVQQEDPRSPTKERLERLVRERCGAARPDDTLYVSIRKGVNLDEPEWVDQLIKDIIRLGVRLLVLDAARRLSAKTDEGPAKVSELTAELRRIVQQTAVALVIVHHDVKPGRDGEDPRRRSHRASGGDWFAASECPIHVERLTDTDSLVYPQDYKFAADPAPFTVTVEFDGKLVTRLVGTDTTTESAEIAGPRGKLLAWIKANGPVSKTAMRKAGFGWKTLGTLVASLLESGHIDEVPGRQSSAPNYIATGKT